MILDHCKQRLRKEAHFKVWKAVATAQLTVTYPDQAAPCGQPVCACSVDRGWKGPTWFCGFPSPGSSASWYNWNSDEQSSLAWCGVTLGFTPLSLPHELSLTATLVSKGKSTVCSARPDYMKSKIWLIIACKLIGKSKCKCTECGFKENSRNHRPGLHGAGISTHCIL